jgi:hypothetical protein
MSGPTQTCYIRNYILRGSPRVYSKVFYLLPEGDIHQFHILTLLLLPLFLQLFLTIFVPEANPSHALKSGSKIPPPPGRQIRYSQQRMVQWFGATGPELSILDYDFKIMIYLPL